jgi:aspartyl-tRNA(Asn)/glutamyl-tRNA(Gln) amidotransferase subunit A
MALSWSLDKLGPMGRFAFDCGLALEAMAGPDPADPEDHTPAWRFDRAGWRRPLRLALPRGLADDERLQPDVRGRFGAALGELRAIAVIAEVDLPDLPVVEATQTVLAAEMGSAFEEFIAEGGPAGLTAPEDRSGGYANSAVRAVDYLRAMRLRGQALRAYARLLAPYDALVTPTLAGVGAPIGEPFSTSPWAKPPEALRVIGAAGNLLGLPAITVPIGLSGDGLPTAITFVGRAAADQQVLDVAIAFQERTAWQRMLPPFPAPSPAVRA